MSNGKLAVIQNMNQIASTQGSLLIVMPCVDGSYCKRGIHTLAQSNCLLAVMVPVLMATQYLIGLLSNWTITRYAAILIGI